MMLLPGHGYEHVSCHTTLPRVLTGGECLSMDIGDVRAHLLHLIAAGACRIGCTHRCYVSERGDDGCRSQRARIDSTRCWPGASSLVVRRDDGDAGGGLVWQNRLWLAALGSRGPSVLPARARRGPGAGSIGITRQGARGPTTRSAAGASSTVETRPLRVLTVRGLISSSSGVTL